MMASTARLPRAAAVAWASRLAITAASFPQPRDQQQQIDLAEGFFNEDVFQRIISLLREHKGRTLFHRLQLLTLLRLLSAVETGPVEEAEDDTEVRHILGSLALGINGYMERDTQLRLEHEPNESARKWNMIAFGVRNGAFHHGNYPLDNLIGRSALLWKELPHDPAFNAPQGFDIEETFQQAAGVTLDEYLAYSLTFALAYSRYSLTSPDEENRQFHIINTERPLPELEPEFDHIGCRVVELLTARAEAERPEDILYGLYDIRSFRQGPLLQQQGHSVVPVDLGYLQEAATIGIF